MRHFEDLRSDQQIIIDELYARDAVYCVMRMGGGKTATALTTFAELKEDGYARRGFILAPPLVAATVWPREAAKWSHLQNLKVEHLTGGPAARVKQLANSDADLFAASDGVLGWLKDYTATLPRDHPLLDILIYDEPKTKGPRSKTVKTLKRVTPRFNISWHLGGTPRPNGYTDLYGSGVILRPGMWSNDFDEWRRRNFMPLDYSGYAWEVHDFRAAQLNKDIATWMIQAPEPPDARHGTMSHGEDYDITFHLPGEAAELYEKMQRDFVIEVMANMKGKWTEAALIAALSAAVASSKLEQLAQGFVYEKPEDPDEANIIHHIHGARKDALRYALDAAGAESSVICYGFTPDVAAIRDVLNELGRSYGLLGGGVSPAQKLKHIDAWNEGRLDHLILHPASAGHGVELQQGGRRMFHFCLTWSPERYDQVLKRIDRPGQPLHTYSHRLLAGGTVDEVKRNRVERKIDDQTFFLRMLELVG